MTGPAGAPYGVYVHVPFCTSRCGYCDFATWTDRAHLIDDYVDACLTDVHRRVAAGEVPAASSVFFGGGTPSLLRADQVARLLDAIPRRPGAEITLECNPDGVDAAALAAFRAAGVTRVSFGVQSMSAHVLAFLDRAHDPASVGRAVAGAREAGFDSFNLDLIYGAASESLADWSVTLDAALALDPPHVSAYALTVEAGTPLGRRVARGEVPAPDDDDQAAKHELVDERLGAAGLDCYEISNWSRPGHECRHNLLYWTQGDYTPIGCAAHGHRAGRRWWNVRTPERYLERVHAGQDPMAGEERLDPATRAEETFALGLRTRAGAVLLPGTEPEAQHLAGLDLLVRSGPRVQLTPAGRRLATDVTARLLAAASRAGPNPDPDVGSAWHSVTSSAR